MIAALERLGQVNNNPGIPEEMAALAIDAGKIHGLFASHPPLALRIKALKSATVD
ncbi:MAG: heat shock protein HtpX [Paraglaciecola sp.]|jgi:heat shock protein HtpX